MITVQNSEGTYRQTFNTYQIKPYYASPESVLHQQTAQFRSRKASNPSNKVPLTEVLHPNDPRAQPFDKAKRKEIEGLIERSTWKVVSRNEVPDNANILNGRFVLAIKDSGTNKEVWKARYVLQGHKDKMKRSFVHDTSTARQFSVKLLVGLAALFDFRLFSTDFTQAYLQSTEELSRDVYVKPSSEFDLDPNQLLKLLKPLYGLADSGDYWGRTLKHHLEKELGMKASVTNAAFFFKRVKEKPGLCATYVEDCLQAGTEQFCQQAKCVERKFKCRPGDYDKVQFAGIKIESSLNGFQVHQNTIFPRLRRSARKVLSRIFANFAPNSLGLPSHVRILHALLHRQPRLPKTSSIRTARSTVRDLIPW